MPIETWFASEFDVMTDACYSTFYLNRCHTRGGGVLLNIEKGSECHLIKQFSFSTNNIECLSVRSPRYMFVVTYLPSNGSIGSFLVGLESVLNYANQNGLKHYSWEVISR